MQKLSEEIERLSSLKNNNSFYEKLIKAYYEKLEVVSEFSSKEDFIKEEIKRVEDLFIQPLQITIGGDFRIADSFDISKYTKIAFDYLKQGMDLEIEKFVKQGQSERQDFIKTSSGADLTDLELIETKTSVVHSLKKGVGFLLYQTYLKKQLEIVEEPTALKNYESDWDFIKGKIEKFFIPQGDTGYFEIVKGKSKRKFTIEEYYNLDLGNWEAEIDKATTKKEKIKITNNAIFSFEKELFDEQFSSIIIVIEKTIKHLQRISKYIDENFDENKSNTKAASNRPYSHKQIAIACFLKGTIITQENALEILSTYNPSLKSVGGLLNKTVSKKSELSANRENATAYTKHLADLKATERLLSDENNEKAKNSITTIITAFEAHRSDE